MSGPRRPGWLGGGAVLAAVLASACCWLPLVAVMAGVSAAGAAVLLWAARPWLLGVSALLLGIGLWISVRRRAACEPGSDCAARAPRAPHAWLGAGALFLTLAALLPRILGWGPAGTLAAAAGNGGAERIEIPVEGMTCAGCEHAVEASLRKVDGVLDVRASADERRVVVTPHLDATPSRAALIQAVAAAGYRAADAIDLAGHWVGTVGEGEDTAALVVDIEPGEDARWVGELDIPAQELENVPLGILVEGRAVRFELALAPDVDFRGELSAGGGSIAGRLVQGSTDLPFTLTRSGEAVLLRDRHASETPADDEGGANGADGAKVTTLSAGWPELAREFNAAAGKARLLLLLSPT